MRNSKFLLAPAGNVEFHFPAAARTLNFLFVAAFFLATGFLFLFSPNANAQLQRNDSERQLFESVNRERTAQGLAPLQWDAALFKAARKHALLMLNLNMLEHQLPNEPGLEARLAEAGARFAVIAENIAVGPDPYTIHKGWMNSPGHRKNILDPRLTSIGIAAVRGPGGLYAVQDFSQLAPELSVEEQEQKVISLLTAQGFRLASATDGARKTCESDAGLAGTSAKSMMRFEVTDLNKLPEEIDRKIRGGLSGKVAVGACRANASPGFVRYRIAVLFF
jgi:Cysteine-rich secretory protein family